MKDKEAKKYKFEVTINGKKQKYTVVGDGAKASVLQREMANKNTTKIIIDGYTYLER